MKTLIHITIGLLTLSLIVACGSNEKTGDKKAELAKLKSEQKKIQEKVAELEKSLGDTNKNVARKVPVIVTSMSPSQFYNYVDVQGRVDVQEVVNAIPETPGIIESILVKPGQYVRKGQVVATLRSEAVDRGIAELQLQIDFAKTLYDKQKRLWEQEIGTEVQLLSAKNQYESLLRKKESTLTQKNSFHVVSPIQGVVDAVDASVGQSYASPVGGPIIRIINTSKLKVVVDVAENYAGIVRTGTKALLVFPDLQDSLLTSINYAERMINPVSRTFSAYIPLPANPRYQPNMITKVKLVTYQNSRAFVLPMGVIQNTDKGSFVYIADQEGKAKLVPVSLGSTYESRVEILSGLSLGDKVVTTGYEELNEGDILDLEASY